MIPIEIVNLAANATSKHHNGWARGYYKKQLKEIRDYIDRVLENDEGNRNSLPHTPAAKSGKA